MAHCVRRPVACVYQRTPTCTFQARQFSKAHVLLAVAKAPVTLERRTPKQPSMKIAMKEQMEMPTDMGLLPDTFIMPTGANKPSIFSTPRDRLKMEWRRIKSRVVDFGSLIAYKWIPKPRLKLRRRQLAPTAVALHGQMYTAFAEGDTGTLRKICADGVYESFKARIAARRGEKVQWTLHKHTRSARVVSDRAARLPIEGAGLRQAVVRIRSRQSLTRWRDGQKVQGTGQEKDVKEYVVIQKKLWKGAEDRWMVWGTTEETTMDHLSAEERRFR
ncbi:MAG: hypothetical protein M1830_007998 [Pleopsidium flavum]|nr:MAG: hypothetical protein M1830_007998 [Pleopsidium flavum]